MAFTVPIYITSNAKQNSLDSLHIQLHLNLYLSSNTQNIYQIDVKLRLPVFNQKSEYSNKMLVSSAVESAILQN